MQIEVVDEIMGTGKSHSTLRYIENLAITEGQRWIFCTEYLDEIERRTAENPLAAPLWRTPTDTGDATKTDHLIELLKEPDTKLVGITHALLLSASNHPLVNSLLKTKGYRLFLDETIDLISPYNRVKFGDFLKCLDRKEISITDPYGKVSWIVDDSTITHGNTTSTDDLKRDAAKGIVYSAVQSGSVGESVILVEIQNEVILTQFERVIVATYNINNTLFDAYLKIKGITRVVCKDVVCGRNTTKAAIKANIEFINKYDKQFRGMSLSGNWYKAESSPDDYKVINKTIKAIGDKNGCKGNAHLLGFTVPAERLGKQRDKKRVQPTGYPHTVCGVVVDAKGIEREEHSKALSTYIPCNARASNEYANKTVMVHAFNRYAMVPVTRFLDHYGIEYSNEQFALNELVQWVWRSAIRNGEKIKLAILSTRMRDLFTRWLDN